MELKKVTEGLEGFITTDTVGSALNKNTLNGGSYSPCYGVPPKPPIDR